MSDLELHGAPLAWLWLFIATQAAVLPALVRGLVRRGSGKRYEAKFWVQRAPQIAIAASLALVVVAFEAIELGSDRVSHRSAGRSSRRSGRGFPCSAWHWCCPPVSPARWPGSASSSS